MLRPEAQGGLFGYNVTVGGAQQRQTVDLIALAQRNGQISALDPTMVRLLDKIRSGAQSTGTINDTGAGNTLQYVYQSEALGNQYAPTGRVDINVTDNHRLSGSYWWQRFTSTTDLLNNVDRPFPTLSNFGTQNSYRTTGNSTLRSVLSQNVVNELRGGWQWSPNDFFANVTADQFAEQDNFALSFAQVNNAAFITGPTATNNPQPRNTTTWSVDNTLNWLRGAHSLSMGGGYAGVLNRQNSYNAVTPITLGFDPTTDPANGLFNATNFPSATANQLNEARGLYAILTGRVSSIPGTARLDSATGKYVFLGDLARKSRQSSFSAFISDQWRATPTLTISGGVRWDLHNPFTPADETWSLATIEDICGISGTGDGPGDRGCNIFDPRAQSGTLIPAYDHFDVGIPAHKTNWFDFAPNVGVAWRPNVQSGWLKALLGDPEQAVVRAGYALSYNQERIDRFTANAGANPGGTLGVTRDLGTGYPLVLPGESAPVLLSQRSRLGPPALSRGAGVSHRRDDGEQRQHLPAGPAPDDAARAFLLGGRAALDRQGHGLRGPLRRQQEHQHVGGRGLERAQRVQQRVLRGVQAGAAQHLGEHRRRASATAGSRTRARRARRHCRSTWPTCRATPARPIRRTTPRRTSPTRRSSTASARSVHR